MRKNIITIIALLASSLLFAQDDVFKAAWVSSAVKIDGNAVEWSQPLRYYDADTKLFFAFANDGKDLYLCFQTADEMNQMKILHGGMEISLSVKGEHKATIDFPLEENSESSNPGGENNDQQKSGIVQKENENDPRPKMNHMNSKNGFLMKDTIMDVKGFTTKNGMIPINDNSGINAAINRDEANRLIYEISIPLTELFGANYTSEDILKHISLGVKVNAMKGQNHSGNNAGNNNFSGKGGKMSGGGGRMGGGGHHNHDSNAAEENNAGEIKEDKTDMFKKAEFKQKFVLAQNDKH